MRETEMKLSQLKSQWSVMSYYQRFESAVAVALTFVIGFIILVALYRLASTVVVGMLSGILRPRIQCEKRAPADRPPQGRQPRPQSARRSELGAAVHLLPRERARPRGGQRRPPGRCGEEGPLDLPALCRPAIQAEGQEDLGGLQLGDA